MDWTTSIIQARLLVANLGEGISPPWWRSQATSPVGLRMLGRLFPRTAVAAALETASRAASLEHDARIGRVGAYHLFRLPAADEAAVRDFLRSDEGRHCLEDVARLDGTDSRLAALTQLAGGEAAPGTHGPVHCGTLATLQRGRALPRLCATYAAGLRAASPVFPYLGEEAV
ncbi:MAG TPA: BrxE family protein [Chloroflexota bacterium]|nr:BrxE family protein [Chloroflexota bacterium]